MSDDKTEERITRIDLNGEPRSFTPWGKGADYEWGRCQVDGMDTQIKVKIRTALSGHPIDVYLNGQSPLYPTAVYKDGKFVAFDRGSLSV